MSRPVPVSQGTCRHGSKEAVKASISLPRLVDKSRTLQAKLSDSNESDSEEVVAPASCQDFLPPSRFGELIVDVSALQPDHPGPEKVPA